jgi:hypothetical protein
LFATPERRLKPVVGPLGVRLSPQSLRDEMSGPTTIGFVSLTLLSLASEAAKRDILGERTRLAYGGLKEKIAAWANSDATILEEIHIPDSRRRRIIDPIELRPSDDCVTVRSMACAPAERCARTCFADRWESACADWKRSTLN